MANKAGDWLYNQEDLIIGIVALVGGAHIILELIMSKTDTMFGMTTRCSWYCIIFRWIYENF